MLGTLIDGKWNVSDFHPHRSLWATAEDRYEIRTHHSVLKCCDKGNTEHYEHSWEPEREGIMECPS